MDIKTLDTDVVPIRFPEGCYCGHVEHDEADGTCLTCDVVCPGAVRQAERPVTPTPLPRIEGLHMLLERIGGICLSIETPGQETVELDVTSATDTSITGRTYDETGGPGGYGDWTGPEVTAELTNDTVIRYI